jgi:hypothetical protein
MDFDFNSGFSFYNSETNSFHEVEKSLRHSLLYQIQKHIPAVTSFQTAFPFILFEYDDDIPPSTILPFKVGGCFAIFINVHDGYPWGTGFIGQSGYGEPVAVDANSETDLKEYTIPQLSTFKELFRIFPNTARISSFVKQIVVELPATSEEESEKLLKVD